MREVKRGQDWANQDADSSRSKKRCQPGLDWCAPKSTRSSDVAVAPKKRGRPARACAPACHLTARSRPARSRERAATVAIVGLCSSAARRACLPLQTMSLSPAFSGDAAGRRLRDRFGREWQTHVRGHRMSLLYAAFGVISLTVRSRQAQGRRARARGPPCRTTTQWCRALTHAQLDQRTARPTHVVKVLLALQVQPRGAARCSSDAWRCGSADHFWPRVRVALDAVPCDRRRMI